MKKLWFLVVFLLLVIDVQAEEKKYCQIGADPMEHNKPLQDDENLYPLEKDTWVKLEGGSGKIYECWLEKGEVVVVKENKVIRVYNCGNEIRNYIFITPKRAEAIPEERYPDRYYYYPYPYPYYYSSYSYPYSYYPYPSFFQYLYFGLYHHPHYRYHYHRHHHHYPYYRHHYSRRRH